MRSHSVPNIYVMYRVSLPCAGATRVGVMPGRRASLALLVGLLLGASSLAGAALDPTQPPANLPTASGGVASDNVEAPLVLQAVLRGAQGSRVIISGQVLRMGDQYAGARVLNIHRQSVSIERDGTPQLLRLVKPVMKLSQ